jgi:hypothetical protein
MSVLPWWGGVGVGSLGVGAWFLITDTPFFNTLWFLFAWMGYLMLVDAAIWWKSGRSFIGGRRRELGAMMFWSVPYWCLFEAYNLRLQNWYYVFLPHSEVAQALFAFAAFSTVLPACFFGAELFAALGWFETYRSRPLSVTPTVEWGLFAFGFACLVLPLVSPRYAFWMVWGATFGIPDVLNRRLGAPSLLADLEVGRPARLLRLLAGGLLAGGVWESLNFWARAKWIYTVPGFEEIKLFEMPFLGFLGFPALAVQAFAAYALFCHWARGGRHWEDTCPGGRVNTGRLFVAMLSFSALTHVVTLDPAVQARRPLLEHLDGMEPESIQVLASVGVTTPEQLVRHVESGAAGLDRAYVHANLSLHKGMGTRMASALIGRGVESIPALAAADAEVLWRDLEDMEAAPSVAQVKVWVRAARLTGRRRR